MIKMMMMIIIIIIMIIITWRSPSTPLYWWWVWRTGYSPHCSSFGLIVIMIILMILVIMKLPKLIMNDDNAEHKYNDIFSATSETPKIANEWWMMIMVNECTMTFGVLPPKPPSDDFMCHKHKSWNKQWTLRFGVLPFYATKYWRNQVRWHLVSSTSQTTIWWFYVG